MPSGYLASAAKVSTEGSGVAPPEPSGVLVPFAVLSSSRSKAFACRFKSGAATRVIVIAGLALGKRHLACAQYELADALPLFLAGHISLDKGRDVGAVPIRPANLASHQLVGLVG